MPSSIVTVECSASSSGEVSKLSIKTPRLDRYCFFGCCQLPSAIEVEVGGGVKSLRVCYVCSTLHE